MADMTEEDIRRIVREEIAKATPAILETARKAVENRARRLSLRG